MAVSPNYDLRPFLAPLLLKKKTTTSVAGLLDAIENEVTALIKADSTQIGFKPGTHEKSHGLKIQTLEYIEEKPITWAPKRLLRDRINHLVVIATRSEIAAICATDTTLRRKLADTLKSARPASRTSMERAFVGDKASVLWLCGVHAPTDSRPSAKTLMGPALEFALDPLGDQSFYYSAVRSSVGLGVGKHPKTSVGAAPAGGRIWISRPRTWDDFLGDLRAVIDRLRKPPAASVRFAELAKRIPDLTEVSGAYDLGFVPVELMEDVGKEADMLEAAEWAYSTEFDVVAGTGPDLVATVRLHGQDLGDVELRPSIVEGRVNISASWIRTPGKPGLFDVKRSRCLEFLEDPKWTKIYYDGGYTIAQGDCYQSAYRDQRFEWDFRSFIKYDVTREKPEPLPGFTLSDSIGLPKHGNSGLDDSLFAYVLETLGPKGWLACDDGSMELADFVHVSDDALVTLIHAKASKSKDINRTVSVPQYEVVVGQAIKNLRHLNRDTLKVALRRNASNQMSSAVWLNGTRQDDRTGLIARAKQLPLNHSRRVIVLQPQLTKKEHDLCNAGKATSDRNTKMKQLHTLMLSARLSAAAVGATFEGWASL